MDELYKIIESLDCYDDQRLSNIFDLDKRNRLMDLSNSDIKGIAGLEKLNYYSSYLRASAEPDKMSFGLDDNHAFTLECIYNAEFDFWTYISHFYAFKIDKGLIKYAFELNYMRKAIVENFLKNYLYKNEDEIFNDSRIIQGELLFFESIMRCEDAKTFYQLFCDFHINTTLARCYLHLDDYRYHRNIMKAWLALGTFIERYMGYSKDDVINEVKKIIDKDVTQRTQKANEARWQGHVEQQRRKYLDLDKQRQSDLGKKLTIKSVATWIYEHHNQDNLEYETIRDHLSKARRGIFTND